MNEIINLHETQSWPMQGDTHVVNCICVLCRYLQGGADSGFRTVKSDEYLPRLLHFHGDKRGVTVVEVSGMSYTGRYSRT